LDLRCLLFELRIEFRNGLFGNPALAARWSERTKTGGRVAGACSITEERTSAGGRVVKASGIIQERLKTKGCIPNAGRKALKGLRSFRGICAGGAAIRRRINRLR
jgi:hypothetical protein